MTEQNTSYFHRLIEGSWRRLKALRNFPPVYVRNMGTRRPLRVVPCCVEEREIWRHHATAKGVIPTAEDERISIQQLKPHRTLRCSRKTENFFRSDVAHACDFPHFLDLPLELRERIYELHLQAYGEQRLTPFTLPPVSGDRLNDEYFYKPIPPHEPAITHVSRRVREESLEVFYSTYRFPFVIHRIDHGGPYSVVRWYHDLDSRRVAAIRHLEIYYCFEGVTGEMPAIVQPFALIIDVDFDKKHNAYYAKPRTALEKRTPINKRSDAGKLQSLVLWDVPFIERVSDWLDGVVATNRIGHLTADDLDDLWRYR